MDNYKVVEVKTSVCEVMYTAVIWRILIQCVEWCVVCVVRYSQHVGEDVNENTSYNSSAFVGC
jgi:hypothetical protein